MMKQYVVDAFTDRLFAGNPAAVCLMAQWLDDSLMQNIAIENNLSETAFVVKEGATYQLRWFTPGGEIDLCGHATLASAYVIFNYGGHTGTTVTFKTRSGDLTVTKKGDIYEMDFPAYELEAIEVTPAMTQALGATPQEAYLGRDLLCIFAAESTIVNLQPDMEKVAGLPGLLTHVSAPGLDYDCVSRSFAPKLKVIEDPVCGSGHCHIAPYWAARFDKSTITAYQASKRGGTLYCRLAAGRVILGGKARLFSSAELYGLDTL